MSDIKSLLDSHVLSKNTNSGLFDAPDPLQVASKFKEPNIALICALFAYGNAKMIVKFLNSLDFSLLDESEKNIKKNLSNLKRRKRNFYHALTPEKRGLHRRNFAPRSSKKWRDDRWGK